MVFSETEFMIRDGRTAHLRTPNENDAVMMLQFIIRASGETEFLMRYPEEYADYTLEREQAILRDSCDGQNGMMIACFVDGEIAGNCQISFRTGIKDRHRASVAIAVLRKYWNLGIGTKLFEEMIQIARDRENVTQIELDYIEGNSRARCLYEKMGFRITGVKPDAIRLKNGRFLNEYMMIKRL